MRKGKKLILGLVSALLLCQSVPVMAAGKAEISLKAKQDSKNEKQLEVNCYLNKAEGITNGKLRIFYDKDQVKLVSSESGESLGEGLCEINDCLTGNKPEGELVAAFASSKEVKEKSNLLEMKFELKDGVEKDDEIKFSVKPEKLSGDSGNVSAEEAELTFVVGKSGEQTSEGTGSSNDKDDDKDKDDNKTSSTGSSKNTGKVKTGDETDIIKYVLIGGGTLLVIGVCAATARKKKK